MVTNTLAEAMINALKLYCVLKKLEEPEFKEIVVPMTQLGFRVFVAKKPEFYRFQIQLG